MINMPKVEMLYAFSPLFYNKKFNNQLLLPDISIVLTYTLTFKPIPQVIKVKHIY